MTQFKPDIKLSNFQEDIINKVLEAIKSNKPVNIAVNATAGSGKSTTIKYIALAAHQAGIPINDIRITVFGKKNSLDLKSKLGKQWEKSIGTLNSTGFGLIQKELGSWSRSDKIDDYKYEKIARELGYINNRGKNKTIGTLIQNGAIAKDNGEKSFIKILELLRLTLREPTPENVNWIIDHFQIENIQNSYAVADASEEIFQVGQEWALEKKIDFADQIWLPVIWELHEKPWCKAFNIICVDEGQDLNRAQLQLSINLIDKKAGISIYVGDKFQSIMGFSGADCHSWDNIVSMNNAIQLPLSVCYRCGKKHIELVNKLYPEIPIRAYENNHDGEILQIKEDELEQYLYKGAKNIMVISRKTAPLVSQCIKLLAKGIPAQVKGRDIGKSLVAEVEAIALVPGFQWKYFAEAIEQYRVIKLSSYKGRDNYEQLKESLDDRLEAILAIYDAIGVNKTLNAFKIYTEDLFSDTDEESIIYFSTIHSSKGLEREDIVIVKPNDVPMRWKGILPWQEQQEDNLHYVAMTRAKNRLIIVGKCDWYKAPKKDAEPEKKPEAILVSPSLLENEHWTGEVFDGSDEVWRCPACQEYNPVGDLECGSCGYTLSKDTDKVSADKKLEQEIRDEPQNQEPNPSSLLSAYYSIVPDRDSAYYGITPEDLNLSARLSPPVDEDEPSDEELKEAVQKAIARFGPKNVIIQAIQQATVGEIAEIMAILDDW